LRLLKNLPMTVALVVVEVDEDVAVKMTSRSQVLVLEAVEVEGPPPHELLHLVVTRRGVKYFRSTRGQGLLTFSPA
jgi:hypothetical protein